MGSPSSARMSPPRRFTLLALALGAACTSHGDAPSQTVAADRRAAAPLAPLSRPPNVSASPDSAASLQLSDDVIPVDLAVSPASATAALLVRYKSGAGAVLMWKAGGAAVAESLPMPAGFAPSAIASHPATESSFFVAGKAGEKSQILALRRAGSSWHSAVVFETDRDIGRLTVGPRPFGTADSIRYRLFFSAKLPDGHWSMRTVTETGKVEYQVAGPASAMADTTGVEFPPANRTTPSAIPMNVHPRGEPLLWQDDHGCAHIVTYSDKNWGVDRRLNQVPCGVSPLIAPNGAAYLYWKNGQPGVAVVADAGGPAVQQAARYTFTMAPVPAPDGRGVIGIISTAGHTSVAYAPINLGLGDVANAWQFEGPACTQDALARHAGFFIQGPSTDQLFSLYERNSYDEGYRSPALVTTDLFWENFGAAFNGVFIILERRRAIPAFWSFVDAADQTLSRSAPGTTWAKAFAALTKVRRGVAEDEAGRIMHDTTEVRSSVLDTLFNFGELKPRGHYTTSEEMQQYFRGVHYLTEVGRVSDPSPLSKLPADVQQKAVDWIDAYRAFIAPPRARLVWTSKSALARAPYANHPSDEPYVFPLSWGLDNEILESTVYHEKWKPEDQIIGPSGPQLFTSGLDVAAVYGSSLASSLLSDDLARFPRLGPVLDGLKARRPTLGDGSSLYERWLDALGVEWADSSHFPGVSPSSPVWATKRLQTALGSWSTLREATVLVNERPAAAEAGEGGFEELVTEEPLGYVEPAPRTFEGIAKLFDALARHVETLSDLGSVGDSANVELSKDQPLRQGIIRRLNESAAGIRRFETMAQKELSGQALSDSEYAAIRDVGGIAEHDFLLYKSLAHKDLALSTPDSLPKIADVAGAPLSRSGVLEVAVGGPLEWRQIVPYFGRRQVVAGSVYSYYEFYSKKLFNNAEWRKVVDVWPHPPWVQPLVAPSEKTCPGSQPH
jgi:uncharacterized protein DUF3160